jgi:diguanylate cyclase (GGDEF)-like protein/PAS domain S-box-containing protein
METGFCYSISAYTGAGSTPARILLVEDEQATAFHLAAALKKLGYTVAASVSSGEEAIDQALKLHPNLVLMDISLPGRIDGISAAQAIRKELDVPVVFLTARTDDVTLARVKCAGASGYLVKPFKAPELRCVLEIGLHKHVMEAELRRSEDRYRALVESTSALICTHDMEGTVLSINPAAATALGYTMEQVVGRNIREVLTAAAKPYFNSYLKTIRENHIANGHMKLIAGNGQHRIFSYTNRLVQGPGTGNYVVGHAQDITEQVEMQQALRASEQANLAMEKRLSRTDTLTGAANRRAFNETAEAERKRAVRYARPLSLAYIDLDNFKRVNDESGHQTGDQVLVCVAGTLRENTRSESLVARLGGDEFALLLPEINEAGASIAIHKMHSLLTKTMREKRWPVTFSIGMVTYDHPPETLDQMVHAADELMYSVKREGKNHVAISYFGRNELNQWIQTAGAAQKTCPRPAEHL